MKKVRKNKARKLHDASKIRAEMTTEEYEAYVKNKTTKTLKTQVSTALWDYDKHQYPMHKFSVLSAQLKARKQEIISTQEAYAEKELKRIEVVLNELKR